MFQQGKILADAQCLCDYNIVAGTKLHLTVKKAEPRNYIAEDDKAREKLIAQLRISLKSHFVPSDVEKIVEKFSQVSLNNEIASLRYYQAQILPRSIFEAAIVPRFMVACTRLYLTNSDYVCPSVGPSTRSFKLEDVTPPPLTA